MNDLERRARDLMGFNPHEAARGLTGDPNNFIGFILLQENSAMKRMALQELGDSYRNMPWEKFKTLVSQLGFETVLDWRFPYRGGSGEEIAYPAAIVAAHVKDKLLLSATSYQSLGEESINGCILEGTIKGDYYKISELGGKIKGAVNARSQDPNDDCWEITAYPIEGLAMTVRMIEESGLEMANWGNTDRLVSIEDYGNVLKNRDERGVQQILAGIDESRRNFRSFIASCPPHIRSFLE